jgi:membrane associated rhomboid family serine protease
MRNSAGLSGVVLALVFALAGAVAGLAYINITTGCLPTPQWPVGIPGCTVDFTTDAWWAVGGLFAGFVIAAGTVGRRRRVTRVKKS